MKYMGQELVLQISLFDAQYLSLLSPILYEQQNQYATNDLWGNHVSHV